MHWHNAVDLYKVKHQLQCYPGEVIDWARLISSIVGLFYKWKQLTSANWVLVRCRYRRTCSARVASKFCIFRSGTSCKVKKKNALPLPSEIHLDRPTPRCWYFRPAQLCAHEDGPSVIYSSLELCSPYVCPLQLLTDFTHRCLQGRWFDREQNKSIFSGKLSRANNDETCSIFVLTSWKY